MESQELYDVISECNICNTRFRPFQPSKIEHRDCAIITLTPSFQAFTRPITSIRFYKVLLAALLGKKPMLSKDQNINEFFFENFYWTHYYKCDYDLSDSLDKIPDTCSRQNYIDKELKLVTPKLVIIIGDVTSEKMIRIKPGNNEIIKTTYKGIDCISVAFPQSGAEEVYFQVRDIINKYISGIDVLQSVSIDETLVKEDRKIAKHLLTEIIYLKSLLEHTRSARHTHQYSEISLYNSVLQNRYYSFAIEAFSLLEQNMRLIAEERDRYSTIDKNSKDIFNSLLGNKAPADIKAGFVRTKGKKFHSEFKWIYLIR
jgi:hypothetical protein